jgi:hypothetical protein
MPYGDFDPSFGLAPPGIPVAQDPNSPYLGFIPQQSKAGQGLDALGGGIRSAIDWAGSVLAPTGSRNPGYRLGRYLFDVPSNVVDPGRPKAAPTSGATPAAPQIATPFAPAGSQAADEAEAEYNANPAAYYARLAQNSSEPPDVRAYAGEAAGPEARQQRLGFSWGKDVPLGENGRPAIDSVLTDPTSGRQIRAHESVGGGGFSQQKVEDTPWEQLPFSMTQGKTELEHRMELANVRRAEGEALDPMHIAAHAQLKAIDVASERAARGAEIADDQQKYGALQARYESALRAIEADPKTAHLPEAEKKKLRAQAEADRDSDWGAYQQARTAARSGALPSGFFRMGG